MAIPLENENCYDDICREGVDPPGGEEPEKQADVKGIAKYTLG